jgi:hypothetical protein
MTAAAFSAAAGTVTCAGSAAGIMIGINPPASSVNRNLFFMQVSMVHSCHQGL